VMIVISFVSMIVLCMEGKEVCMEEGTCVEENRSLSRSMEAWERKPGRLCCCFIYTPISTVN